MKRGATTTTKEEENGNYYGKKTDDDDDDFAPEEIKASSFSPSSRAFCASSSVRCDVVLRSLENLFYFVRFCISEREREKKWSTSIQKKRMKRTAFFAACQKFKREIILFCPFFDINSALFSVPLIYELDRTHRVVLLLFLACEVREHLDETIFLHTCTTKKKTQHTRFCVFKFFSFFSKISHETKTLHFFLSSFISFDERG